MVMMQKKGDAEGCAMGWSMSLFLFPKGRTRRLQPTGIVALVLPMAPAASSCSVSLTTCTGFSSSLSRSDSSCRSLGGERGPRVFATPALSTLL